ncbi:MAG: hypothetical protein ABL971_04945 [Vicinamibacterales bacterium]
MTPCSRLWALLAAVADAADWWPDDHLELTGDGGDPSICVDKVHLFDRGNEVMSRRIAQ